VAEWDSKRDYEKLRRSPEYQRLTVQAEPPARIEALSPLRSFARMSRPPAYIACIRFVAPPGQGEAMESVILNDTRYDVEASEGLVSHDVFCVGKQPGQR
jgi:hypothetical protein